MTQRPPPGSQFVVIGNWDRYKRPPGNGLSVFALDVATGALELLHTAGSDISVGAVLFDGSRDMLYCVDETTVLPGFYQGGGGQVCALAFDRSTGMLREVERRPSYGSLPSGIAQDSRGEFLLTTHHTDRVPATRVIQDKGGYRIALVYDDATTVLFPLGPDGTVGTPADVVVHSGDGGPLLRQTHPQLHSVTRSPLGDLFLVCDKGNDEVVPFGLDRRTGRLAHLAQPYKAPPGSSPRYLAFHPHRPFVFLNHETQAIVTALRYDLAGELAAITTRSVLPDGCADTADSKQSDIVVHPSGRYLYSLVRGADLVTSFDIDQESGAIVRTDTVRLDGRGPRAGRISPDGRFLVIAALDSREVLVWAIDDRGRLRPTGMRAAQPNPGTVTFVP